MPASVESYLRVAAEHLLGHATVTRGESRRDVQLADFVHVELEKEVPKPGQLGHVNETEAESAWQGRRSIQCPELHWRLERSDTIVLLAPETVDKLNRIRVTVNDIGNGADISSFASEVIRHARAAEDMVQQFFTQLDEKRSIWRRRAYRSSVAENSFRFKQDSRTQRRYAQSPYMEGLFNPSTTNRPNAFRNQSNRQLYNPTPAYNRPQGYNQCSYNNQGPFRDNEYNTSIRAPNLKDARNDSEPTMVVSAHNARLLFSLHIQRFQAYRRQTDAYDVSNFNDQTSVAVEVSVLTGYSFGMHAVCHLGSIPGATPVTPRKWKGGCIISPRSQKGALFVADPFVATRMDNKGRPILLPERALRLPFGDLLPTYFSSSPYRIYLCLACEEKDSGAAEVATKKRNRTPRRKQKRNF
ncbi:hypothetical protein V8E54_010163 [Elaphomyces granulatus]